MANILITGGTGMIGSALTPHLLQKEHSVTILTRDKDRQSANSRLKYATWDPAAGEIDKAAFSEAEVIIHLAGANVGKGRWTNKRKKEILRSRVSSGQLLVKAVNEIPNRVHTLISSSAIGWYGPDPNIPNNRPFTESDPPASDFLGTVVQQWEGATEAFAGEGRRRVVFRTGIVLSRDGGAYPEFERPTRFGMATVLGSGKQVVSWIHIHDLVRLYEAAIEKSEWNGTYNAVTPQPVSNRDLMFSIARAGNKSFLTMPVPSAALKLVLGEMSVEVLKSTTVSSAKTEAMGFEFDFPTIEAAVKNLRAPGGGS